MKVLFVDIDGVLNNDDTTKVTKDGFCFVDDELVARLKQIVKATGAKIVLSSDWRLGWHKEDENLNDSDFEELRDKFHEFGLEIFDSTPFNGYRERYLEIQDYLNQHNDIEEYTILDDIQDMNMLMNHHVWTNYKVGLSDEDVHRAIDILNNGAPNEVLLGDIYHAYINDWRGSGVIITKDGIEHSFDDWNGALEAFDLNEVVKEFKIHWFWGIKANIVLED